MAATTYTGANPNAATSITGVGFQPDFTWIKSRVTGYGQALFDSVRGATRRLQTDTSSAEATSSTYLTSFNSNGFSLGVDFGQNAPSEPYISWNWKANGAAVSNTAGSITSQVSANAAAGFSVVTYTGTGANATVGHGLGVAPSMMILKNRDQAGDWCVYHTSNPATNYLQLNLTSASSANSTIWNNTAPTSSVFSIGGYLYGNGVKYVAYCFAAVPGYSAFGSYTGNGSADGPFVYLGFRPRFVMVKSSTAVNDWWMYDSARSPYNAMNALLRANLSSAEVTQGYPDFLSNGWKIRNTGQNDSGQTYIYMAFAENPFAYANAR
jgi:hypothetical protein